MLIYPVFLYIYQDDHYLLEHIINWDTFITGDQFHQPDDNSVQAATAMDQRIQAAVQQQTAGRPTAGPSSGSPSVPTLLPARVPHGEYISRTAGMLSTSLALAHVPLVPPRTH